jgi:hypothetical protein
MKVGFASRYGTRVFQRWTRRNEVSREELAEFYSPADLSFLILSVYALVLNCDSKRGDFACVVYEGNDRQ